MKRIDNFSYHKLFSVCTLVSDMGMYKNMVDSFRAHGFSDELCEFLYIDHTHGNRFSASDALNILIASSSAKYIILCHQDISLIDHADDLQSQLHKLDQLDPDWAVAGNAGGKGYRQTRMHITDGHDTEFYIGTLPERVDSIDENFMLLRRSCCLGFAHNNTGFHFYGADLCLNASARGFSVFVIDFHLKHFSGGNLDRDFQKQRTAFSKRYGTFFRTRWLTTTCTQIPLSGSRCIAQFMEWTNPWGRRWLKLMRFLRRFH